MPARQLHRAWHPDKCLEFRAALQLLALLLLTTEPLLWVCQAEYRQHIEKDAAFERRFQQVRTRMASKMSSRTYCTLLYWMSNAHKVLHCVAWTFMDAPL